MERLHIPGDETPPDEQIRQWGEQSVVEALDKWQRVARFFPRVDFGVLPADLDELRHASKNFDPTFEALCRAESALLKFGDTPEGKTSDGLNIGHSMRFVLIPWTMLERQTSDRQYGGLPALFYGLSAARNAQNRAAAESWARLDTVILRNIQADTVRYMPDGDGIARELTTQEYLQYRLERDGSWGMILIQASNQSGLRQHGGNSPTLVTPKQNQGIKIAGELVGRLGVFEALALTLQEEALVLNDEFWLPANRMENIPIDDESLSDDLKEVGPSMEGLFSGLAKRQIRLAIQA